MKSDEEELMTDLFHTIWGMFIFSIVIIFLSFFFLGLCELTEKAFFTSSYLNRDKVVVLTGWVTVIYFVYGFIVIRKEYKNKKIRMYLEREKKEGEKDGKADD